jgi:hypothetical protein
MIQRRHNSDGSDVQEEMSGGGGGLVGKPALSAFHGKLSRESLQHQLVLRKRLNMNWGRNATYHSAPPQASL